MVNLCYNPVDGVDVNIMIQDVHKHNPTKITIFNELEWELNQITPEFVQFLKDRNIQIEIIFGSFHEKYYDDYCDRMGLDYSNLTFWPTFWMKWSEICLKNAYTFWGQIDYTKHIVNTDFKYPFISLNNKNHTHRAALIDHLAKYNLLDSGVVTWHKFNNQRHQYKFKYYDDSIRLIDDDFVTKLDSFLIPRQWHESFLHVVGEANINVHFISEKIAIPMLLKKPFVSISKQGANQRLLDLGFVLYDEIIDYSYDNYEDVGDRADKLCESISKMPTNYSELYEILRPKIEYNYNRLLEIVGDKKYLPQSVIDRVAHMKDGDYIPMHTDLRYERILKECND
jgi:hypothetical protein